MQVSSSLSLLYLPWVKSTLLPLRRPRNKCPPPPMSTLWREVGFQSFDRAVRTSHPHYADMLVDPNSLHVTLLHMELTSKQYAKAFSILEHFQSVSDFGPHILFAKLVPNDAFRVCKLADTLRSHFIRAGFSLLDKPQFVPHCTVIKTYLHDKHSHETIDYSLGVMYADFDFGTSIVDRIEISVRDLGTLHPAHYHTLKEFNILKSNIP
ncbi:hypothetical protein BASA60_006315 [Batrachochytrium salamandrivorans]|nr:hypothetical protein BASA60_006315 [Batrachochytrium salamandrivorans]